MRLLVQIIEDERLGWRHVFEITSGRWRRNRATLPHQGPQRGGESVATPASTHETWRFGVYEVDTRRVEVRRAGTSLKMREQSFLILVYLLEHAGEIVTREELRQVLWPTDTFVDFDHSLSTAMMKLRDALGDSTEAPVYIETIPKRGYRFIAPVSVADANGGLAIAAWPEIGNGIDPPPRGGGVEVGPVPVRARGWAGRVLRRRWLLATMVAVAGLLASAIWYMRRPLPPPRLTEYTQLTHDESHKVPVGTDGARVYLFLDHHRPDSAQVAISGGEVTPFPLPLPNPMLADVSSDGSSLLVASFYDCCRASLWTVQVAGGSLRRLVDDVRFISRPWASVAWSPDGKFVTYYTANGDIYVVRSDGTESRKLVSAPDHFNNGYSGFPSWSPDGSKIRFTWGTQLWEISSSGSGLHQLVPGWRSSEWKAGGRWTPDGRFYVFNSRDPVLSNGAAALPASQIWALDERHSFLRRAHPEPIQLTSGPTHWGRIIPGKDGKTIFTRGVTLRGELVRFDTQSRKLEPYLSGISAEFLSFSPDGKFVAYVTFPGGILWKANRDGSNPVQITDRPIYPTLLRWSPDGRQILFSAGNSEGRFKIYLLPSEGGKPEMILPSDKIGQFDASWSPDGRKIVFTSNETAIAPSKRIIRILDLSNGQITDVPGSQGRWSPRWSPDGRYIDGLLGADLTVFDFKTQQWSVIQKGEVGYPWWSHDGKFIYFLRPVDDPGVYRIRPSGGEEERIVDLTGFRFIGTYAYWMGLDPEDSPLLLRDTGTDDIFALTLDER